MRWNWRLVFCHLSSFCILSMIMLLLLRWNAMWWKWRRRRCAGKISNM
jgi:hypothetical protein